MLKICLRCNLEVEATVEVEPETSIHYAKTLCPVCGHFIDWLKKPENEGLRSKSSKFTPEQLNTLACELCGRNKSKLGSRETLEIHHKLPVEEQGGDVSENILVLCTPCHRMAHFLRTYLHKHLDIFYGLSKPKR